METTVKIYFENPSTGAKPEELPERDVVESNGVLHVWRDAPAAVGVIGATGKRVRTLYSPLAYYKVEYPAS